jgi:hypothetical protein
MNMRRRFFPVLTVVILYAMFAEPGSAQNPRKETRCHSVGGAIRTNFLTQTGTQGTSTGDLFETMKVSRGTGKFQGAVILLHASET